MLTMTQIEKSLHTELPPMQWTQEGFWQIVEKFHQSLYRYYAVHTNGDLASAQEMTAETFALIYRKPVSFTPQTFTSWLFGIAWDVLNAHYSRKDEEKLSESGESTLKVLKLGSSHAEMRQLLKLLRKLPFYPRETLYLRFFAELDTKDIGVLMDKSETSVKVLVLQGLTELITLKDGAGNTPLSRERLVPLAQEYDQYFKDTLIGNTPRHNVPVEAIRGTNLLRSLRDAVTMKMDGRAQLIIQLERTVRFEKPSATRL